MERSLHGVGYDAKRRRWKARIHLAGKERFIARFDNSLDAAFAYDCVARAVNTRSTSQRRRLLNFPDALVPASPAVAARLESLLLLLEAPPGSDSGGRSDQQQQEELAYEEGPPGSSSDASGIGSPISMPPLLPIETSAAAADVAWDPAFAAAGLGAPLEWQQQLPVLHGEPGLTGQQPPDADAMDDVDMELLELLLGSALADEHGQQGDLPALFPLPAAVAAVAAAGGASAQLGGSSTGVLGGITSREQALGAVSSLLHAVVDLSTAVLVSTDPDPASALQSAVSFAEAAASRHQLQTAAGAPAGGDAAAADLLLQHVATAACCFQPHAATDARTFMHSVCEQLKQALSSLQLVVAAAEGGSGGGQAFDMRAAVAAWAARCPGCVLCGDVAVNAAVAHLVCLL